VLYCYCLALENMTSLFKGSCAILNLQFPFFFLQKLLHFVTETTNNFTLVQLERLYAILSQCIYRHREDDDKTELVKVNFFLSSSPFHHCDACVCYGYVRVRSGRHAYVAFLCTAQVPVFQDFLISVWKKLVPIAKPCRFNADESNARISSSKRGFLSCQNVAEILQRHPWSQSGIPSTESI